MKFNRWIAVLCLISTAAFAFDVKDIQVSGAPQGHTVKSLPAGLTLYVFDIDKTGQSNCNGVCAEKWPPILLSAAEVTSFKNSKLGTINRASGLTQLTYENRPVYTFYLDRLPGDTLGEGLGGVWHTIQ